MLHRSAVLLVLFLICGAYVAEVRSQSVIRAPKIDGVRTMQPLTHETRIEGGRGTIEIKLRLAASMAEAVPASPGASSSFQRIAFGSFVSKQLPSGAHIQHVGEPGQPELPYLSFAVAVPDRATDVIVRSNVRASNQLRGVVLQPAPSADGERTMGQTYFERQSPTIKTSPVGTFRQLRLLHVRVPLADYDPATKVARIDEKLDLLISFAVPQSSTRGAFVDRHFASVYRRMVINESDIERFAVPFKRTGKQAATPQQFDSSVTNWIDRDAGYVKFTITKSGFYRVTAQELEQSGVAVSTWRPTDLRLFNRGIEIPLHVQTNGNGKLEYVEFYGKRLPGMGIEYFNWETDSNAYWLTNSSKSLGEPLRYSTPTYPSTSTIVREGIVSFHHERDYDHYNGKDRRSDEETAHRTQWIPGERFIWRRLTQVGDILRDTFSLASAPSTSVPARFEILLNGISFDSDVPENHRAEVFLNGQAIIAETFAHYDSVYLQTEVQASQLREGQNVVEVRYGGTTSKIDQFYVDFYRISVGQTIRPGIDTAHARGQLPFTLEASAELRAVEVQTTTPSRLIDTASLEILTESSRTSAIGLIPIGTKTGRREYVLVESTLRPNRIIGWNAAKNDYKTLEPSAGADYIVIYHPLFKRAADLLKIRREGAGLRSMIVSTDELYNTFSYGSNESWSIRRFLEYAYHNFAGAPPGFVTLLGDASWDPKFNRTNLEVLGGNAGELSRVATYVPSYGIPASDFIFTTVDGQGIDSVFPEMVIARIPVQTADEAEIYVNKLFEYEQQPPANWNRDFMFVVGGDGPPKSFEHYRFLEQVNSFIEYPPGSPNYAGGLKYPPLNIRSTIVPRADFSGSVDNTRLPILQSEFRQGKSLVWFTGHGATFTTDVFFGDPGLYRNKGLYPVFITLSCRTGAFAEPYAITLNEAFMRTPDGGVIQSFGTTGFGEIVYDYLLSEQFFEMMRERSRYEDTTYDPYHLNTAAMFTAAKVLASLSSFGFIAENSRLQYSVLGDAAMGFIFRPQPELNVSREGLRLSGLDEIPKTIFSTEEKTMKLRVAVNNFGYSAEGPVVVRTSDESQSGSLMRIDTLQRLDVSDTLSFEWALDTNRVGEHTFRITVDPFGDYTETNESDNEIAVPFTVTNQAASVLFPFDASRGMCGIDGDTVRFLVQVPPERFVLQRDAIEIEVDTTMVFNAPRTVTAQPSGFPIVEYRVPATNIPASSDGTVYWRLRTRIDGRLSPWKVSSFNRGSSAVPELYLASREQLMQAISAGLVVNTEGRLSIPQSDTIVYTVVSQGAADSNVVAGNAVSQVFRNRKPIYSISGRDAIAILTLTADGTDIEHIDEFDNPPFDQVEIQQAAASRVDSAVRAIPEGRTVIVLTVRQPFVPPAYTRDTNFIRPALRSLGAKTGLDSLYYFGSYAMIGRKGAAPGEAIERTGQGGGHGAEVSDTLITLGTSGLAVTPFTAVAERYAYVRWSGGTVPAGSDINFTILGQRKDDSRIERLTTFRASRTSEQDISSIDARVYSRVAVEARFERTSSGTESPSLGTLSVAYRPAPEYTVEALEIEPDTVEEGYPAAVSYRVRNLLCFEGEGVETALLRSYLGGVDTIASRSINLAGNSAVYIRDSMRTVGYDGVVIIRAIVNPFDRRNEQLSTNNGIEGRLLVVSDTADPILDVLFDNKHIINGDFVSDEVEIQMRLLDASPIRLSDSLSISAVLRHAKSLDQPVTLAAVNPPMDFTTRYELMPTGELQAVLTATPKKPLKPGDYSLTVYAQDASGNTADTVELRFKVATNNGIQQVMNYPNPFTTHTDFTFVLRGNTSGAQVKVHVYTIGGRKIRTLTPSTLRTGINFVPWDGRDENGNEVANGSYPYRVVVTARSADGAEVQEGVSQTAVRSR